MKRKTYPYHFANALYAKEFFNMLVVEYPTASITVDGEYNQYICLDNRARKKLVKQINEEIDQTRKRVADLEKLIIEVEKNNA